ncbi:MAG: hypothetical protein KF703_00275 [Actinobacteria bacterium]|nr:hypothetical protein [Actinomycetota bacterium]
MIPTDRPVALPPTVATTPRPSRPVLRLLALATSILVLLLVVWWTGAVAPRVRVHHTSASGQADPRTGWAYASFEVTNDGRFPVHVRSVEVVRDRDEGELQLYVRDPDIPPEVRSYPANPAGLVGRTDLVGLEPFDLPGGTSREVVVLFELRCMGDWPSDATVEADSALGVGRTFHLDGPPLGTWSVPQSC